MANLGATAKLINAKEVGLLITNGSNNDVYLKFQESIIQMGHPEFREETTDGVDYFYGSGDNFIEFVVLGSSDIISDLVNYIELDANGYYTPKIWKIKFTPQDGSTAKTLSVIGTLAPQLRVEKPVAGVIKYRGRIRITQEIANSDIT